MPRRGSGYEESKEQTRRTAAAVCDFLLEPVLAGKSGVVDCSHGRTELKETGASQLQPRSLVSTCHIISNVMHSHYLQQQVSSKYYSNRVSSPERQRSGYPPDRELARFLDIISRAIVNLGTSAMRLVS